MNFFKDLYEGNRDMIGCFSSIIIFLLGLAAVVWILDNLF